MTTPFIVNHLWQSSCFALLAGLLAFVLRKNSPKIRYWVWLSASLKFLIPFALLVTLGSVVPRPARDQVSVAAPVFPNTIVQIAQPFPTASSPTVPARTPLDWVPVAIGVVWALGFFGNHAGAMPQLVVRPGSPASQHAHRTPDPRTGAHHAWRGGAGHRWFSAPSLGSTGPTRGTPQSSTAWRYSHARDVSRAPPGQFLRRGSHGSGGDLLVPSAGVVAWISPG